MLVLHNAPHANERHGVKGRLVIDPFQVVAVSEQLDLLTGQGVGCYIFMRSSEAFLVSESFDEVMVKLHEPIAGFQNMPEDI